MNKKLIAVIFSLLLTVPSWAAMNFTANPTVTYSDSSLHDGTTAMSWSCWVNVNSNDLQTHAPFAKGTYPGSWSYVFQYGYGVTVGGYIAVSQPDFGTCNFSATYDLTIGKWFHIAMVYDGNGSANADRIKVFVNGIQQTLTIGGTVPTSLQNSTDGFLLGNLGGLSQFWNGKIDDMRIYNYPLSVAEIKTLALTPTRFSCGKEAGCNGYWPLNERDDGSVASGATVLDRSGNGQTGTPTNSPTWTPGVLNYP